MTRGRARRYLLVKQGYYPQVVADAGYTVFDWSTLNAGTLFQDSAKTTPASANGDVIGCWTDGVGGVDATQVTTANKPGLATASLNGLPTLSFDGGDFLETANISISTFAVWAVVNFTSIITSNHYYEHNIGNNDVSRVGSGFFSTARSSIASTWSFNTSGIVGNFVLFRHAFNATNASHILYKNDVSINNANSATGNPGTGSLLGTLKIGARSGGAGGLIGNTAQLLIMSPYPTDASIIANMESYINNQWNGVY